MQHGSSALVADQDMRRAVTNAAWNHQRRGRTADRKLPLIAGSGRDELRLDHLADAVARLTLLSRPCRPLEGDHPMNTLDDDLQTWRRPYNGAQSNSAAVRVEAPVEFVRGGQVSHPGSR